MRRRSTSHCCIDRGTTEGAIAVSTGELLRESLGAAVGGCSERDGGPGMGAGKAL